MSNKNSICNSHYNMRKKKLEKMKKEAEKKWLDPRRYFINSFINHQPLNICPECGAKVKYSLITSASSCYVAGVKIDLPYGIRL